MGKCEGGGAGDGFSRVVGVGERDSRSNWFQTAMLRFDKTETLEASSLDEWGPSPSSAEIDWSAEETVGYGQPPLQVVNDEDAKEEDIPPDSELK